MAADLVVIGGGNMGTALLTGLVAAQTLPSLAVVEPDPDRRLQLNNEFAGAVAVHETIPDCSAVVLAVKPPDAIDVALAASTQGARRIISVAAGVSTAAFDEALGKSDVAVIRSMPNTPALVGAGLTAICGGRHADEADLAFAEQVLGAVGRCVRLPEEAFDAVTAVTGSGPAYVMAFAEALIEAGVRAGLEPGLAGEMVTQLLVGSAALLAERGDPAALRVMVTSPGGTTAAGLAALEAGGFAAAISAAVEAAAARSRELGTSP